MQHNPRLSGIVLDMGSLVAIAAEHGVVIAAPAE
jgi:hypothetical protein